MHMDQKLVVIPQSKILLVDDSLANLHFLSKMLVDKGFIVEAVSSGQSALNSAFSNPPELILLDIHMPEMDGYETCRQLKSNPRTSAIPIIFVSALEQTEDKIKAFKAGGVDYIAKPFQIEEVLVRLQTHLTIHQLQNDLLNANQKLASDVLQLKQMESAEHEQRVLAETFRDIATSISSNLDLEKVLDMILFGISQLINHDVINISMIDHEGYSHIVRQLGYEKYID